MFFVEASLKLIFFPGKIDDDQRTKRNSFGGLETKRHKIKKIECSPSHSGSFITFYDEHAETLVTHGAISTTHTPGVLEISGKREKSILEQTESVVDEKITEKTGVNLITGLPSDYYTDSASPPGTRAVKTDRVSLSSRLNVRFWEYLPGLPFSSWIPRGGCY